MRNLSWRVKLMALFTLVLGASLLFQMFYVIPTVRNREVEMTKAYQEEIARNIAWEMDNNLKKFRARLMEIAGLPEFRSMNVINQHRIMVVNVEATPFINSLFVMDAAGRFVSGSVSADDFAAYTTKSYADQPFFTVPFEQGQVYFGTPRFYPNKGLVSTSVSVRIESETGERVGVLIGGLILNDLMEHVANYPLEEGMVACLVDREGTVVAHSGIDTFALEDGPLSLDYSDRPLVRAIMDGEMGGSREHDHDGTPYFGTYTILESNDWGVVVGRSMSSILAESDVLARQLLAINVGLFAIALAVTLVFTGQITAERERAEQVLRESEERFREMASLLPQVVGETDLRGNFTFVNQNAFQMFGYTQKDFEKDINILQVLIPEDHERVKEGIQKVLKGERPGRNEYTAIRKDGSTFPVLVYSSPAIRQNKPAGMISIVVDITEQKRAEEALRRERDFAESLIETAQVIVLVLDTEGQIVRFNPYMEEIAGYDLEKVRGKDWFTTFLPQRDQGRIKELFLRAVSDIHTGGNVNTIVTKDGRELEIEWYDKTLKDASGNIVGFLAIGQDITKRVRAAEALRESEERLWAFARALPDLAFILDESGRYVEVLTTQEHLLYAEAAQMKGCLLHEVLPEEAADLILAVVRRTIKTGKPQTLEYELDVPIGRVWIEGRAAPMRGTPGEPQMVVWVSRDITERVRAEEALKRRAAQLALLNDAGARIAAVLEPDILLDGTTHLVQESFGYHHVSLFTLDRERGELVMKSRAGAFNAFFPPEHRIKLGQGVVGWVGRHGERLLANDVDAESHYINFYPDVIPTRSELSVPIRVGGEVVGVLDVQSPSLDAFDESDVMVMETLASQLAVAIENARLVGGLEALVAARTAEIVAEQEKNEAILRSVDDAIAMVDLEVRIQYTIAMVDLEVRIQYVNDAFTALTGYTAGEALGQPLSSLMGPGMSELDRQSMQLARARGEPWQGEVTHRRKDGRVYEAALTIAPMRDAEGNLTGYVSSHQDISRRKGLERARSRFMTNVSHELRTPVANMKLYANLLRMGRKPEKTQYYAQVLEEQADRLAGLVQDILEMTELDSGRAVMAWKPVSLPTVIGDTVTRYQSRAEASGLTLVAKPVPPGLPVVRGDQSRLAQALGELVENAVIFTPAGGQVTVETDTAKACPEQFGFAHCKLRRRAEEQRWVTVAVHDTGPGISPEEQERVFDRFYRGSLAESGHVPGTGLGLSFAQEIVRAHGGRVTVESEIGEGSTFTLWLPSVPHQPDRAL